MTYKELINRIRTVAESHLMIKDFGYGELSDIKTQAQFGPTGNRVLPDNKEADYPYMFLLPGGSTRNDPVMNYNFSMIMMDMARGEEGDDYDNYLTIQSQCQQYIDDCLAQLYYFYRDQPMVQLTGITYTPFKEAYQDEVAGMTANFTIQVPNGLNDCIAPFNNWSPALFDNIQYWWTADAGITLDPGDGKVSTWTDQINSYTFQTANIATRRPELVTSYTLGTQKAISFNGTTNAMETGPQPASWTDDITILWVGNIKDPKTGGVVNGAGVAIGGQPRMWIDTYGVPPGDPNALTFVASDIAGITGNRFLESPTVVNAGKAILQRYDGSTGNGYYAVNSLTETELTGGTPNVTSFGNGIVPSLGALYDGGGNAGLFNRWVEMEVAESVWIYGTPTTAELLEWRYYVNTKYGNIIA